MFGRKRAHSRSYVISFLEKLVKVLLDRAVGSLDVFQQDSMGFSGLGIVCEMFVVQLQLLTDMEENVTFNLSELEPKFQSVNVSHTEGVASARETQRISLTSSRISRRNGDLMSIKEVVSRVFLSGMLVSSYRKAWEKLTDSVPDNKYVLVEFARFRV